MLQPTGFHQKHSDLAYPLREKWVCRNAATPSVVGSSINNPLLTKWVCRNAATHSVVGSSINNPLLTKWVCRNAATPSVCRLKHQRPTSHEVGMQECS